VEEAAGEKGVYKARKEESKTGQTIHRGVTESRRKIETVMVPRDQRNTELESEEDVNCSEGEQQWSRVTGRRRGSGRR
jgi:hypothetical protein